jgi:hypothetical protein
MTSIGFSFRSNRPRAADPGRVSLCAFSFPRLRLRFDASCPAHERCHSRENEMHTLL